MKIRKGFISNSSTTAFMIYGLYRSIEELKQLGFVINPWGGMDLEIKKGFNLDFVRDQNGDGYYIGRSLSTLGDKETGEEFKAQTLKMLDELFSETVEDARIICTGWYNG